MKRIEKLLEIKNNKLIKQRTSLDIVIDTPKDWTEVEKDKVTSKIKKVMK